jgi:protein-S-isoprenylcysteine O-methyltransferase Ste14
MNALSPVVRLGLLAVAWVVWILPAIVPAMRNREKPIRVDPRARWGLFLESAGYFVALTHGPNTWAADLELWRAAAGGVVALGAIFLFRSAVRNLGRQWRFDAGLNRDHDLVQTGAYRLVRHPIYASMFGMLLASIFWVGTLPGWPISIALFIVGTEIRVRVEDSLLRERFGDRFVQWQRSAPAYLPWLR